jgi:hypothetical protein
MMELHCNLRHELYCVQRYEGRKLLKKSWGYQKLEVTHVTGWRVLWMKGEFKTKLIVEEDRRKGKVTFDLKESDAMKAFHGCWHLKPCKKQALEEPRGSSVSFIPFSTFAGLSSCAMLATWGNLWPNRECT